MQNRYERTEYIDIDSGEILRSKDIKKLVYRVVETKVETKIREKLRFIKTTKFIKIYAEQKSIEW